MAFKRKQASGGIPNLIQFAENTSTEGNFKEYFTHKDKDGDIWDLAKIVNPAGNEESFFVGGQLRYLLQDVEPKVKPGDYIKVTYLGKTAEDVKTKKGGLKKLHQYTVDIDPDKFVKLEK
jgi:hypothetical protein